METLPDLSTKARYPKATSSTIIQPLQSLASSTSTTQIIQPFAGYSATTTLHPIAAISTSLPSTVSGTMRRSNNVAEIPLPITYTPTTHRISKAKKGKRVHACEFPGCNKVFTRAEHRRRHELNHNPEASFPCTYEGCRKAFHRSDLLQRHMERHELEGQSDSGMSQQWRHQSKSASITSAPTTMITSVPLDVTSASYPTSQVSTPLSSASPVIGSAIHPDLAGDYSLPWNGMEIPLQPRPAVFGSHIRDSPDDLPFYSSPDTCGSPASDAAGYGLPPHPSSAPTSVMEPFAYSDLTASPLQLPAATREWDGLDIVSSAPNMMPLALDGNQMIHPVESSVPIPLSHLDGDEWYSLRRELTSAPGVLSGDDGMEIIDTVKWQDCFECYWEHFHPLFPIVHRPTFFTTKPSPLLSGAMVAIGSQFDTRPNAKEYSLALLEACNKLLAKRPAITSRSRVNDIQAVFLLEHLSKFRSRKADVQISHRFRSLYGSFMQDRHWVHVNPLAVLNTLPPDSSHDALNRAQKFWVEHETRRRVLQAAFILDVLQSKLFGQPSVSVQPSSNPFNRQPQISQATKIPFPCCAELWESKDLSQWVSLARSYVSLSLPSAAASIHRLSGLRPEGLDYFQAFLILTYSFSSYVDTEDEGLPNNPLNALITFFQGQPGSHHSQILFSYHTLMAVRYTPLHTLLTVSGESWLFNQKIAQEGEFWSAKTKLRQWVSDTDDVKKAIWHAVRALHYAIHSPEWQSSTATPITVNTAWTRNVPVIKSAAAGPSTMLQATWSVYTCVLICWAYGFDYNNLARSETENPPDHQADEARTYIHNMISLAPTWRQISQTNIPAAVRCNMYPLLQYIRMTQLHEGRTGGLLHEANRVLARLSEPRGARGEIRGMWSF
ncbi:C2H2 finger domain protein, putative [Talaromyces stipitatus ATCC 10500]|uniref:C2H2 finger domain protein, putative n=1 Tax=Talaromyces stipitatus (strain ATCC 10500 / CBS 375.48 / QM 6759 / NRRL 1006) TaxID=441959 RepID=B8M9C5_TALSN|nr:C2H2 finger domain protein, putative [Talaromyces stipitatus ATCC 10500]EED17685.1 C2H2 finger domain protein, putative [Talaromyces stipitatus ATCC 10500]